MKNRLFVGVLLASVAMIAGVVAADSKDARKVQRSMSGGSGGADTIVIGKQGLEMTDADRAQLKLEAEQKQKLQEKRTRTVQRSFSGGAGSADQIEIKDR